MAERKQKREKSFLVGIDVGSTTTKTAVIDAERENIQFYDYQRHNAAQVKSVCGILEEIARRFPGQRMRVAFTGSGAKPVAEMLGVPYIQEVVANSIILRRQYKEARTAIELGGQDAKMIFFSEDKQTGSLKVKDMRMNGSCAGGTGAFIDEIASILKVPVEEFDDCAGAGNCVYDISGRCGVYAKTDIQPLLNQGVSKENLALSAFHAIAKQTIGGLAQGLDIKPPVVFEGGPLTFNPTLIRVFAQRLELRPEDILIPEHPEIMIACGAALSLNRMFAGESEAAALDGMIRVLREKSNAEEALGQEKGRRYFETEQEKEEFIEKHRMAPETFSPADAARTETNASAAPEPLKEQEASDAEVTSPRTLRAYLGIDSGSTTTKFVLMDEDENILDSFYAPNEGNPLMVAKRALIDMRERYTAAGITLDILAAGTTGYGEQLFSKAFQTEYHVVETVAHATAASRYVDDVTFILDIGGQDMKAIWIDNGIITNIVLNEACSSGCGSFLENFASGLHIPVDEIAQAAFSAENPAQLGSRCTVFMNSSIVTEQRNGKTPQDIMAGLCRSIIENVFTKVIRISNLHSLGEKIVVQGGTFKNDAVLRAMEQYLGKEVIRAPYPGIMGAIGAALLTKERFEREHMERTFIGLEHMEEFSYSQESNSPCPFCANHCKRTILRFSNGNSWVTNNRCERGEILGDPREEQVKALLRIQRQNREQVPNLFKLREKLLFQEYEYPILEEEKGIIIGIPRVLFYWDSMPFWGTFWRSLGFQVKLSDKSTREIYEQGLSAVTSDTVCFPAKLVHGHIRNLVQKKVDRIFMPVITAMESENTEKTSESMCAVVKGYPLVVRNSDNPKKRWGIPFDTPLFHWHKKKDRDRQLTVYMEETFGIAPRKTQAAIAAADEAWNQYRQALTQAGREALEEAERRDTYAVVLASRPYQNDSLVNHDLPEMFTEQGIAVLTADSVPGIESVDLSRSRLDIVNNYHARMLASAILAAQSEHLEYVQIVSFGCGHDAYLSDEIIRLMKEISGKTPLVLKLDESDIQGPLRIRVRSFVETIARKRARRIPLKAAALADPYPVKFTKKDVREKIVLVPNSSHAFSRVMSAAFATQHIRAVPLAIGREEAIRLGKEYVHNDICFPAQIVVGEILAELKSGKYDNTEIAVAMAKYVGDCRLTHYSALLRKAMDDAGFANVPILTNDDVDYHNIHPGFKMNLVSSMRIAYALPMIDVLEELLRKIRPYELEEGSAQRAFDAGMDAVIDGLQNQGIRGAKRGFECAIEIMKKVPYDRSHVRPGVMIVGEYLLNFHPGANHDIEKYLEKNGFEIIEARMTDVIRKTYFYQDSQNREYHLDKPLRQKLWMHTANEFFEAAQDLTDSIAKRHPLYTPVCRMPEMVKDSDPIIHHTFDAGEGVLIPAEIIHHAKNGCKNFVILQPFGCLPNHVVGRGVAKRLKEMFPDVQILPLDYDPDVSFANIENRLQMMIMNQRNAMSFPATHPKQAGPYPGTEQDL